MRHVVAPSGRLRLLDADDARMRCRRVRPSRCCCGNAGTQCRYATRAAGSGARGEGVVAHLFGRSGAQVSRSVRHGILGDGAGDIRAQRPCSAVIPEIRDTAATAKLPAKEQAVAAHMDAIELVVMDHRPPDALGYRCQVLAPPGSIGFGGSAVSAASSPETAPSHPVARVQRSRRWRASRQCHLVVRLGMGLEVSSAWSGLGISHPARPAGRWSHDEPMASMAATACSWLPAAWRIYRRRQSDLWNHAAERGR